MEADLAGLLGKAGQLAKGAKDSGYSWENFISTSVLDAYADCEGESCLSKQKAIPSNRKGLQNADLYFTTAMVRPNFEPVAKQNSQVARVVTPLACTVGDRWLPDDGLQIW